MKFYATQATFELFFFVKISWSLDAAFYSLCGFNKPDLRGRSSVVRLEHSPPLFVNSSGTDKGDKGEIAE